MIPTLPKGFTHPMVLGKGVFSSVVRARQVSLDRWVAIKILKEKNQAKRAEQLQEAQLQAAMQVSCVPEVFDVFEWRKQVFIVMQWVKGTRLSDLLNMPLSNGKKIWIAEAVIQAVANLHENNYVHCDLKPENILISPQDGAFLVDFGFSYHAKSGSQMVTESVKGTPAFMAPELWMGREKVDYYRADVYAIGKMLLGILGKETALSIVEDCLEENPDNRPSTGGVLLQRWYRQSNLERTPPDWRNLAAETTSTQLSQLLFKTTESLLHLNRVEEAYWLLAECLEENPNHSGALKLMGKFPVLQHKAKRKGRVTLSLFVGVLLLAAGAFFFGFKSGKEVAGDPMSLFDGGKKRSFLLKTRRDSETPAGKLQLKTGVNLHPGLTTRLKLQKVPSDGRLTVDEKIFNSTELKEGCNVPSGAHLLAWESATGKVLWTQEITLLPFQTMTIQLPQRLLN